ncbi:MAG TPA: hypothetical protein VII60_05695 [Acidimicrobiales bacterium]
MEIINRNGGRWPNPKTGPFDLWTTFAIVNGRAEVVGIELWAVDPASLDQRVTHLTKAQALKHWPRRASSKWDSREGFIRSRDLRSVPLAAIVAEYMTRQRHLARAEVTPGLVANIVEDAKRFGLVSPSYKARPTSSKRQKAARRILYLKDKDVSKKPGRPALKTETYLRVAEVYVEAIRNGLDPLQQIMKVTGEPSKANAGKLVSKCRHIYGFLTATTKGKAAGELTQTAIDLIRARDK